MDAVKKLLIGHGEKLITAVICLAMAYWLYESADGLMTNKARNQDSNAHLEKVAKAVKATR